MKEYDREDAVYYDYYLHGLEGDVEFYIDEAKSAGSPVMELGCGTGRILIPVAKAGIEIVGLDSAPAMLGIARRKVAKLSAEVQNRIELIEGDMSDFSLGRRFNLIMVPYRAFMHLLTSEDQRRALQCIRDHLAKDGLLVFNIFDPKLEIITQFSSHLGSALLKGPEFINRETGCRVVQWITRRYDRERQTLEQDNIFEEIDDNDRVVSRTYRPLRLRYSFRYEMEYLLEICGFRAEALYGDFKRGPFCAGVEQIWLARPS
jgi:ubiquinone/menaquinone biosynthesis C-methylase UbiE